MKNKILFISTLCLCACSNDTDLALVQQQDALLKAEREIGHKLSQEEALRYTNLIWGDSQTRSTSNVKVDYVIEQEASTRGTTLSNDTVAYIFNWENDNGFAIVSADDRIYPILAYSETGKFVNEKGSLPDLYFTSKIGTYIKEQTASPTGQTIIPDSIFGRNPFPWEDILTPVAIYKMGPYMSCSWCWNENGSNNQWNKYIEIEHPGCKIGCVAVATASLMVHCKDHLSYHNTYFPLAEIREGLRYWQGGPDPNIEPLSRDIAVDYAAQLLYWVGKDVNMNYSPDGSAASPYKASALFKQLGFICPCDNYVPYDLTLAVDFLSSDNLILMSGRGPKVEDGTDTGHSWVADGYRYSENTKTKYRTPISIRFDWGMGGYSNGYYSGEVFFAGNATYNYDLLMFPIKVENPNSVFWDKYRPSDFYYK